MNPEATPRKKQPWLPVGGVEARVVILGFLLLFCVLGGYFAVRPVRETIGTILGRQATQNLWLYTAFFAILIVPFYGWLVAHIRRSVLLPTIYGFMALAFIATAIVFGNDPKNEILARVFYVGISVLNLMLVSVFWSFMLEILSSEQTKRLFGLIAAGGTTGALVGPLLTSLFVTRIGNEGVLFLGAGMFIAAVFLQRLLIAQWHRMSPGGAVGQPQVSGRDRALGGNPFAGFMLVMRNPYLVGIMLFVVGVSAINTFLYFEQLELVEQQFEEITKRTQVFASLDAIVQALVVVSQLFLTGFIATRLGLTVLLVTIPIVMVFGLTVFAISGTFIVLAVAMVIRRWGEYAFIRPGREMLFSKVDKESKYKAKNLIDVAVYRISDAAFAQLKTVLEALRMGGTAEAMFTAGLAGLWAFNGWWLGRRHEKEKEQKSGA
jgi:AAA family ATP:ADP antiporter